MSNAAAMPMPEEEPKEELIEVEIAKIQIIFDIPAYSAEREHRFWSIVNT